MSDLGFDEGGVLQALATPILHHESKVTKKYKSGRVKEDTTTLEVTGAHVVALLLGSALLALFLKYKDMTEEEKERVKDLLKNPSPLTWLGMKLPQFGSPFSDRKTIEEMEKRV